MSNISKISFVMPTIKSKEEINNNLIELTTALHLGDPEKKYDFQIIATCQDLSAAKNRNICIDKSEGDIIVMMDDDVTGFYPKWYEPLIYPLINNSDKISIVSARPLTKNGQWCAILGDNNKKPDLTKEYEKCIHTNKTGLNVVGSACIAFRRDSGVRFDENYLGCCYEDTAFCMDMNNRYPEKEIVFANKCNIIHNMEAKGRGSSPGKRDNWLHNYNYFSQKYGIRI